MSNVQRSLLRYGFACAVVGAALALTWAIPPFRQQTPDLLLFAATVTAAWYGGLRPGLLAALLAVFALDALLPPLIVLFPGFDIMLRTGVFLVGVLLIISLKERSKRMEREHRHSVERFQIMAETVPDVLFTARADGTCEYVNQRFADLTSQPLTAILGRTWWSSLHPEDAERNQARWTRSVELCTPFESEYRLRVANGDYRWFVVRARPIRDEASNQTRWVGTWTDMDDQKRAQQALAEADRRKDEFLAMLGHELRNPLNPVRSAVEVLRLKCNGDADVERMGAVISRQIDHMVRLVDDLLDVSRITEGKIELLARPLDLGAAIARAVEEMRPLVAERKHRLEVELPATPLSVVGDADRLEQVFANLLSNAARYTPPGGHIHLSARIENALVVVGVRDNGIGIRPEMLPRIFDVFQQADRVPGRVSEGLGLGLALVRRLVELHGGSVEAASRGPGMGSEFCIRLPLIQMRESGDEQSSPAPSPSPQGKGLRVLVVDDNADGAESLALLLRLSEGHEVQVAHDGPAALDVARAFRPEVVLLDIGLPKGMDGYQVAQHLRAMPEMADALLVALTGFGRAEDRRRSEEVGFQAHLVKPVDPEQLHRLFQGYSKRHSSSEGGWDG